MPHPSLDVLLPKADPTYQPMVSLHIPAYNEPPEILIDTIKAVEADRLPGLRDRRHRQQHGRSGRVGAGRGVLPRSDRGPKFVHVGSWPGYKAGACNLALRQYTDPRAEIIGLIDADDIVQPYYLRETVPYFSDPRLGFVQTFEGNRDYEGSAYYTACVDSYQGFYLAVMSSRNERDTVPFVGTMGLFRRSALDERRRLERVVHQRGHRGVAAGAQSRLVGALHTPLLRARHRPADVCRPEHPASPVVLRRHADPAAPLAQPHALGPLTRQPSHGRPAPGLPDGVAWDGSGIF